MLRTQLRNEVFDIIKKTGVTVLFVTHDTQDALSVADEILILQKGKVVQKDAAANLYVKPNNLYVASLFGDTVQRSEEHTSELQSRPHLVCRLLLEKKKPAGWHRRRRRST